MIGSLQRHAEYRATGSPWVGNVPSHWRVAKLRTLITPRNERGRPDLPLLSVARERGVFVRSATDKNHNFIPDDLSNYKVARTGNLVINKMKAWQGSMGVAPADGIVSPAYFVYDLALENRAFAQALLRSKPYVAHFAQASDGVRIGQWDLSISGMREIPVVLPPPDEQRAIVRFLDHVNRRVERFIRAKRRSIAALREQRLGILRHAVLRGINPHAPRRSTRIPWIGDVPAHWTNTRVKNEFACLNTRRVPLNSTQRGAMKARSYDYYGASGVIDRVDDYLFDDDLILIAEDGANLVRRNLPLAIIARGKFWVNNHAHILKPRAGNIEYLAALLETIDYSPWITGAAQPKLTKDRLMSVAIAVPPPAEQGAIAEHCARVGSPLSAAMAKLERDVELVREYRTRLLADVVTGQLDVRAAAASLPDEAGEPEALDDAGEGEGEEDAADEGDAEDVA